jgi:hypothetical protein
MAFIERAALEAGAVTVAEGDEAREISRAARGEYRNCDHCCKKNCGCGLQVSLHGVGLL